MTMNSSSSRTLRADAERNRERLIEAASFAFATSGLEVSMEEIGRRAGLGKGTVFRRFPSKESLVAAIACCRLSELADQGEELVRSGGPGSSLREFMHSAVQLQCEDRGLFEVIGGMALTDPEVSIVRDRLMVITRKLLELAQQEGQVRKDIGAQDIFLLVCGISSAATPLRSIDPNGWKRYLDILFDGLRPRGTQTRLHPAPSEADLRTALESGCCPVFGSALNARTK